MILVLHADRFPNPSKDFLRHHFLDKSALGRGEAAFGNIKNGIMN